MEERYNLVEHGCDPMEWKYDRMEGRYDPNGMEVGSNGRKVRSNGMKVQSDGRKVGSSGTRIRSNGMQVAIRLHFCPECPFIVFYQQIENGNIANQIHGFTRGYGTFILIFFINFVGNIKARPNADRNISMQHIATLLGATCCVHLGTLLRRVRCCWLKFENGHECCMML